VGETSSNPRGRSYTLLTIVLLVTGVCILGFLQPQPSDTAPTSDSPALSSPPTVTRLPKPLRREGDRVEWGIYQIYWGAERFEHFLDITLKKFSSQPGYVMFYRDLGRPFPARAVKVIRERGATPSISLELWQWHQQSTKFLPAINEGKLDEFFETWARDAKAEGGTVLLRFGFEFNGEWFSWSGDPAAFVSAWRRAHDIFKRVGADNVKWVWAPNITSVPDTPDNNMHRYYPGDAYVDWVGVDGYNWGDHYDEWHRWQTCQDVFEKVLAEFDRRYAGKPVMLSEFGSVEDTPGRKARWVHEAFKWLSSSTRVSAVIWFNLDKRREGEHDWRIDSSPESLAAFNKTFAKPSTPASPK